MMTSHELSRAGAVRVLALQAGGWGAPASEDIGRNARELARWTDEELGRDPADLVVLPELSTTPYFCIDRDERHFEWAEPIPGTTTELFGSLAAKHQTTIVLPIFERSPEGRYHNTAVVIGPDGKLTTGHASGREFDRYRKCHVPSVDNPPDTVACEDHYFTPGDAFPVFDTPKVRIGILICFDRWFPEAWRMLLFEGAQLVVVPMVAWGFVEGPYLAMLQSRAVENAVFVASCNRSAFEELDGVPMPHFGRSMILGPDGEVIAGAARSDGQRAIAATLDLEDIARQGERLPLLRYRRADLYGAVDSWR